MSDPSVTVSTPQEATNAIAQFTQAIEQLDGADILAAWLPELKQELANSYNAVTHNAESISNNELTILVSVPAQLIPEEFPQGSLDKLDDLVAEKVAEKLGGG